MSSVAHLCHPDFRTWLRHTKSCHPERTGDLCKSHLRRRVFSLTHCLNLRRCQQQILLSQFDLSRSLLAVSLHRQHSGALDDLLEHRRRGAVGGAQADPAANAGAWTGTLTVPQFGSAVTRVVVAISPLIPVTLVPVDFSLDATVR